MSESSSESNSIAGGGVIRPENLDEAALDLIAMSGPEGAVEPYRTFTERFPMTVRYEACRPMVEVFRTFLVHLQARGIELRDENLDEPNDTFERLALHYYNIDLAALIAEAPEADAFRIEQERAVAEMFAEGERAKKEIDILLRKKPARATAAGGGEFIARPVNDAALIAVVCPVLNRPQNVVPLIKSLEASTLDANLYFVVNDDDYSELDAIVAARAHHFVVPSARRSWAKKINDGYQRTHEPWILCIGDDVEFHEDWVHEIKRIISENPRARVIGTNDLGNAATMTGRASTHPLVSRAYADEHGTIDGPGAICFEGYHHNYPDTELVATARARGVYAHARYAYIEHYHPLWGKSEDDDTYKLGQSRVAEDRALFEERAQKHGWLL